MFKAGRGLLLELVATVQQELCSKADRLQTLTIVCSFGTNIVVDSMVISGVTLCIFGREGWGQKHIEVQIWNVAKGLLSSAFPLLEGV